MYVYTYFNISIHVEIWKTKGQEILKQEKGKANVGKC